MPRPGAPTPSFEKVADQIKTQAQEKQGQVRENIQKTEQGIEQLQQKAGAIKGAIKKVKGAIAQLQSQAQQNPQMRNHPMFQKRMNAYQEQLSQLQGNLKQVESQIEMLRNRKTTFRGMLIKIAAQAAGQLANVKKQFDANKQKQQAQQGKRGVGKGEGGKVRG
jgi:predicted RNase H-like nuclease (RuvC/YqgF family)